MEQSQESLCQTLKQGDENRVGIMKGEKVRQEGGERETYLPACWEWVGVDSLNPTDVLPSQIQPTETDVTLAPSLNRARLCLDP